MPAIYAQTGPPFNFLGNMSETQRNAFTAWISSQSQTLPAVQTFHQIRAQQLRKTGGLLEQFYAAAAVPLAPSFIKATWKPAMKGHFAYGYRNDHLPAMAVSNVKDYFRAKLVHMDDAVFHMNHLRTQVERHEDLAQYANDGVQKVPLLMDRLQTMFGQPEYQGCLVKDITDQYCGQARFRTNQFDTPTPWELATRGSNSPVKACPVKA